MAGATGLILSFLAGVMVGRGVDQGADVQAARTAPVEERVVTEETVRPAPPPAEELTYAQRLESDKADEGLEKPANRTIAEKAPVTVPAGAAVVPPAATLREAPAATVPPAPPATRPTAVKPSPSPKPAAPVRTAETAPAPAAPVAAKGQFTIQVGAFKDRASADAVMGRLKGKGFSAYVVPPAT